jgi:hypothetical protein
MEDEHGGGLNTPGSASIAVDFKFPLAHFFKGGKGRTADAAVLSFCGSGFSAAMLEAGSHFHTGYAS